MVVVSLTHEGHTTSILQSGQTRHWSAADRQRLRFEIKDMKGRWDQYDQKEVILVM